VKKGFDYKDRYKVQILLREEEKERFNDLKLESNIL
jgi:hypothetical protein